MVLKPIEAHSPEWHTYRQGRITATDCAAILGAKSFKSPAEIWARLTGREMPERVETPMMRWGLRTEEMHAQWFAEETGLSVEPWGGIEQHPDLPWLCCTPDYRLRNDFEVVVDGDPGGVLELKAPSAWNADEWKGGVVPLGYQVQVAIQMACSGATWGHASALVQPDILHAPVERDERFIDAALNKLTDWFERHVIKDTPPPATAETAEQHAKFLRDVGASREFRGAVQLSDRAVDAHERLVEVKAEIKALESEKRMHESVILAELQNSTYGVIDGNTCYRFRKTTRDEKARDARTIEITDFRFLKKLPADCVL